MGPPLFAELEWAVSRSDMDLILRQAMTENHKSAAGMKLRGYDQNAMRPDLLQTVAGIIDFRERGRSKDWADRHATCFAPGLYVSPADVHEELVIDQASPLRVEKNVLRQALMQQVESVRRASIGFTRQDYDGVGFYRIIDHQETRGLTRERDTNNDRDPHYSNHSRTFHIEQMPPQ